MVIQDRAFANAFLGCTNKGADQLELSGPFSEHPSQSGSNHPLLLWGLIALIRQVKWTFACWKPIWEFLAALWNSGAQAPNSFKGI
jgi:hypothetical protein